MERTRKGIQSIEVGGQLLVALGRHGAPMMLRDLAREAGMPAAKAHPYLVSFGKIGLVEQDAASGRYRLGGLALQLGLASMRQSEPIRLATEAIAELKERVGHTTALSVWGNRGPTIAWLEEMDYPFHVNLRVGTVMSLASTATGQVFAAFLPPAMVEAALADDPEAPDRARLEAVLAEVRRHGMARVIGNPIPGVNAFAAPVLDHTRSVALAVTVTGPAASFDADWNGPIARALRGCCSALSHRLGYPQ